MLKNVAQPAEEHFQKLEGSTASTSTHGFWGRGSILKPLYIQSIERCAFRAQVWGSLSKHFRIKGLTGFEPVTYGLGNRGKSPGRGSNH